MQESTIKNLQATMKLHGFYDGTVDGVWGNQSHAGFYAMAEAATHCKATDIKPVIQEPVSKYKLSQRSLNRLKGVHPDLVKVVKRAIELTEVDFTITEGLRSITTQKAYVAKGASKTMNSRHLTGHAVDLAALVDGKVSWDWKYYHKLYDAMSKAAKELGVTIEWGGNWQKFKDGPHYQLPWSKYPAK